MGESILEFLGIDTLKKKFGAVLGVIALVLLVASAYYYYTMPKDPASLPPAAKKVSGSPLAVLLEDYTISILDSGNATAMQIPSSILLETDLDWVTFNTACGRTGFDLRRFSGSQANSTAYLIDEIDYVEGKPVYLHVISVNSSIACAYKTIGDSADFKYGLSQVLGSKMAVTK